LAVFTPNIKVTLRVPKITNRVVPATDNSLLVSGNCRHEDLEIDVTMEADDNDASDEEDGLASCAHKQAAGTLEEYEEDDQRLPEGGSNGTEEDEDGLAREEIDMIYKAEQLALQQDEPASDSEGEDSEVEDTSSEFSDKDDKADGDFIPKLKLKGKAIPKEFRATGGKKCRLKVKKDANYIFCPLPHRLSILCLLCKHFCQHPLLQEQHGQSRTHEQIHRDAVLETYYHLKANNLREVWAYLWTNWYTPGKWELWARSSCEGAIPRRRTTMLVEALWRNYKRMVLYHYNRPCVDLATYTLVTQGIAPYRLRFNRIVKNPRDGRAKGLQGPATAASLPSHSGAHRCPPQLSTFRSKRVFISKRGRYTENGFGGSMETVGARHFGA
jgi:hypothetical protein